MEQDRWNKRSWRRENILQWFPPMPQMAFLWLPFMGKSEWAKGYWVHHVKTNYLVFEVVTEGELTVLCSGQRYPVPAGSAVLIPPGESKLSASGPGGCRKHFLCISGPILNNNLAGMNLDKICVLNDFRNAEFDTLYATLWKMIEEKNPEHIREYNGKIYQMLLLLSHCAVQHPYPEELQRAVSFISLFLSKQIDLNLICSAAHCGRSTLQWQFKHYMDSSPIRYLTESRMEYALKLLENTQLPVKEIAQKCGYSDQLYFSNTFRSHYGKSPREYRKNMLPLP